MLQLDRLAGTRAQANSNKDGIIPPHEDIGFCLQRYLMPWGQGRYFPQPADTAVIHPRNFPTPIAKSAAQTAQQHLQPLGVRRQAVVRALPAVELEQRHLAVGQGDLVSGGVGVRYGRSRHFAFG